MRRIAVFLIWLALGCGAAAAQEQAKGYLGAQLADVTQEEAPLPMLDTGGHMAAIRSVIFTPDGSQLVSASDDKTIRVWDVATGKTLRTIRGEAALGEAGKIFAMALSPDGKWLAAGGWTRIPGQSGHHIRLYDFASGKLVALLKGHEDIINRLAFSPNGQHLISGSDDNTAIIWDRAARKAKHRLKGHRGHINAVGFTPDGARAVTGSYDHDLRLWSVESGVLLETMRGHGNRVFSLAVAPDGAIASGDDSGEIRLWHGQTGAFLRTLARQKTDIGGLSFSPGSKALLSVGGDQGSGKDCHVYEVANGREILTYSVHDSVVSAATISPDGRWAATGGGNNEEIHIWDLHTGTRRQGSDGRPLTLAGTGRSVFAAGFSADGRQIGWGNTDPCPKLSDCPNLAGPLQYALMLPSANGPLTGPQMLSPEAAGVFGQAIRRYGAWSLSHRKGGAFRYNAILDIKESKTVRTSIKRNDTDGFDHSAYTFSHDGQTVFSGGDGGVLAAYTLHGEKLGDFVGHESDISAVAPSPDGRYLVSGSADQTVRLWNLNTRELLVTLFRGADGEWVMWTPQGYYAASGPGSELIGWQINHGPEHEAEYVTAAQLRKSLNRPDIVARAIQLASAGEAVKEANGTNFKLSDLLTKPVPRLRIVSPLQNATLRGGSAELEIALEATPDPVKSIRIQVNGRQIAEHQPEEGGGFAPGKLTFPVPLAKGRNTIRVVAVNDTGETPAEVAVTHDGEGALDKRGTLYILAIGVDKYPNLGMACRELDGVTPKACDLDVAGADAKEFAKTMAERLGPQHESVVSRVLVNGADAADAPTAANVLDALGTLRQSQPNDTILLFVSGHGLNEGQSYRFLATDAAFSGGALRNSTVVPWVNFQETVEAANGRRILFLDTCHSGNSYNQRLSNDSYAANIIVYSAARWDQEALERGDLGHGLFTYAVVEGVNGAAKNPTGEVKTESLRDFLGRRVPEMAKALKRDQEPQYFRGRDAQDYLLAVEK